jgi:hypothetical protein
MQIVEKLKILADTSDNQTAYLIKLGTSPSTDELALQFTDTYQVFKGKLEEGNETNVFNETALKKLESINLFFDEMGNIQNNSFWDISCLDGIEWSNIRRLARETLQLSALHKTATVNLTLIEESNYDVFGMKHQGYNNLTSSLGNSSVQGIKYNRKELQEE